MILDSLSENEGTNAALPLSSIEQIRENPTPDAWLEEFDCLLDGLRDREVGELGDVSEYINIIISGAKFPVLALRAFTTALNELLQNWQPLMLAPSNRLYYILLLIKGFTPKIGFIKLAGFLRSNQFYGKHETPMGWATDFQRLALTSLDKYFPVTPISASEDRAYQVYLEILKRNFEMPDYFGYAAARLIALKEYSYNSWRILEGLTKQPQGLTEIIDDILENSSADIVSEILGTFYTHYKNVGLLNEFKACLESYGEIIEHPLTQVQHPENRIDVHRYPGVYFADKNNRTILLKLESEETFRHHDHKDLSLVELKNLLADYSSANRSLKEELKKEIAEEISSMVEKALASKHYEVKDVLEKLRDIDGEISTDDSEFSFVHQGQTIAQLNIVSKPQVLGELMRVRDSRSDFYKLARLTSSAPKQINH